MSPEIVLAVMLEMRQAWEDRAESREQRTELLRPLASELAVEARDVPEAAALITIAYNESGGFARWVLEGRCAERPKACDRGAARGPFQLHQWCKATDLKGEVKCAARAYRTAIDRCNDHELAFGHYASGNRCYAMPERETVRVMVAKRLGAHP